MLLKDHALRRLKPGRRSDRDLCSRTGVVPENVVPGQVETTDRRPACEIYLNREAIKEAGVSQAEVEAAVTEEVMKLPGVGLAVASRHSPTALAPTSRSSALFSVTTTWHVPVMCLSSSSRTPSSMTSMARRSQRNMDRYGITIRLSR